jgi:hypothetical protein
MPLQTNHRLLGGKVIFADHLTGALDKSSQDLKGAAAEPQPLRR